MAFVVKRIFAWYKNVESEKASNTKQQQHSEFETSVEETVDDVD